VEEFSIGTNGEVVNKMFFLTWCFSSYCESMHINTLHVHHWNKILKIWWKGEKTDVWQSFFPIFVPKVSCFVHNQWQWCPSKVSTNCMHYDDSEWINEFDQCVLKKTNRDELYNKKVEQIITEIEVLFWDSKLS
jgi:hypothetical protein